MNKFYVGFSTKNYSDPLSWLIRKILRTPYSHVYVRWYSDSIERDLIYEASGLKVHFVGKLRFLEHSRMIKEYEIEISDETKKKVLQFAIDNANADYSIKGLIGMGWVLANETFGKQVSNPFSDGRAAYICSELIGAILEEMSLDPKIDLDTINPRQIDDFLGKYYEPKLF